MARIALEQDWMVTENGKVDLTPGMAVTAEIHTGQRRLISYLLSPAGPQRLRKHARAVGARFKRANCKFDVSRRVAWR
jgi:hypothetical protein